MYINYHENITIVLSNIVIGRPYVYWQFPFLMYFS